MRYPIIELLNEIWRILKPGGTFTSFTPCYPAVEVHEDPTHLSVWTLESMAYFCGKYPVAKLYGVKTRFILEENRLDRFYLHAILRKPVPDEGKACELLDQLGDERFLFLQLVDRGVDLRAAEFVDRHVLHDLPFAAAASGSGRS